MVQFKRPSRFTSGFTSEESRLIDFCAKDEEATPRNSIGTRNGIARIFIFLPQGKGTEIEEVLQCVMSDAELFGRGPGHL